MDNGQLKIMEDSAVPVARDDTEGTKARRDQGPALQATYGAMRRAGVYSRRGGPYASRTLHAGAAGIIAKM